ncbi:MAG: carbohydrate-binding domain-containing protein [Clostridia bacterium]|nr:carbohydrate-binding domain-containing protein [Clostridia bacterium]
MKKCKWIALLLLVPLVLTSCDILDLGFLTDEDPEKQYEEYFEGISTTKGEICVPVADLSELNLEYSERDLSSDYDGGSATRVVFADSGSTVYGKGAESDGKDVVISAAGTYIISGSASGASLVVNATDEDDVHLVLLDVSLSAKSETAFDIRSAASVVITLAGENKLSDSSEYKPSALDKSNGAVFLCRKDVTLNGAGSLSIVGNRSHGIVSLGGFVMTGGKLNVRATKAGLVGEGYVKIGGGQLHIEAEEEGILSGKVFDESELYQDVDQSESDRPSGYVYISGGFVDVTSTGDAISAESFLIVKGGVLDLTTGVRIEEVKVEEDTPETLPDFWDIFVFEETDSLATDEQAFTVFSDGIYAASDVLIYGGTIVIDASNHAISSGRTLCVDGGRFLLNSVHDGLYAKGAVGISDGILIMENSRRGIEGGDVRVSGGYIYVGETTRGLVTSGAFELSGGVLTVAGAKELPLDFGVGTVTGGVLVALGNAKVAREFFPTKAQGVILCQFDARNAGYPLALCDNEGKLLVSLKGKGGYSMAYISMPEIARGNAYTLVSGGFAPDADLYGFSARGESMIGSEPLAVVTARS